VRRRQRDMNDSSLSPKPLDLGRYYLYRVVESIKVR